MKLSDGKRLVRIYSCMGIPGCFSGPSFTQSMSVSGAIGYAHDCSWALPRLRMLLSVVYMGESYEGKFEEMMTEVEKWFAKRGAEGWASPGTIKKNVPDPDKET